MMLTVRLCILARPNGSKKGSLRILTNNITKIGKRQ
jgi:hypothetical protein